MRLSYSQAPTRGPMSCHSIKNSMSTPVARYISSDNRVRFSADHFGLYLAQNASQPSRYTIPPSKRGMGREFEAPTTRLSQNSQ